MRSACAALGGNGRCVSRGGTSPVWPLWSQGCRDIFGSQTIYRFIDLCVNQYVFHYASNYLCFSTRFSPLYHRGNHVIVIILWWTIVARCKQKVTLQRGKTCIAKRPWQQAAKGVKFGGSCRIRTYDQLIKSQLLYQLS